MSYLRYVKVVGTMHVSPKSREEVVRTILAERPDAVAVELDPGRMASLFSERSVGLGDALKLGPKGLLAYFLQKIEEELGEDFGMRPGEEMKAAVEVALSLGIPIYPVDQPLWTTISKMLKAPTREKILMVLEILSFFLPLSGEVEVDDYRTLVLRFKTRYPYLYRVLVDERNEVIAKNIMAIVDDLLRKKEKPKVVAVVGLGHKAGVERILNAHKPRRLTSISK
ncbi:TraB domain-containing protein [Pyrococcus yayanosii]|uniref:Predicted signaling protein, TraB family n=1 Tax=Pyrococcus yayanosii (strain CH1 / JCM 16557) TaxID=529709 RepID=F8AIX9_PYRYC|nr:TraB/GumN family protein [Pyrococcus yayanosii]AEH24454.1 Predicted signaling protein, TraB family [Pyrococcus yayanosii CH1]